MKKIAIRLMVFLAVGLTACGDFLDINVNPNYPANAKSIDLLPSAQVGTVSISAGEMQLVGSIWSQFYTQNVQSNQYNSIVSFSLTTASYQSFWRVPYYSAIKNFTLCGEKAKAEGRVNLELISKAMKAFNFHLLTNWYGDVPFSEVSLGAENRNPKFEHSKTEVYPGIVALLDEAIALKDAALESEKPGSADMVFGGDVAKWVQFAKTLKLKLLMFDFQANKAAIEALLVEGDLLSESAVLNKFTDEFSKSNPLYESDRRGLNTAANLRMCATLTDTLVAFDDPRRAAFGEPITNAETKVIEVVGLPYASTDKNFVSSRARLAATDGGYLLTAAESFFLQAEAHLRLGDKGAAGVAYDKGVKAAFAYASELYNSYSGIDAQNEELKVNVKAFLTKYTANQLSGDLFVAAGGAYFFDQSKAEDVLLNQIALQKWIASVRNTGWNSFFDINRLGQPAEVFATSSFPKRMLYPDATIQYNNNAPAVEDMDVKLWWQK